jgi:hypothetical protein
MATDEPLREDDLPPQSSEQGSEKSSSPIDDQTPPMIGDLVHRSGESSGEGLRDAMARDSDPPGKIELLGVTAPQPTGTDSSDGASQRERDDAPADEPHGAAVTPPVDDEFLDAKSQSAASPDEAAAEPVDGASDVSPSESHPAAQMAVESSDDDDSSFDPTDEDSSADEAPADSRADTGDTTAMDLSEAPPSAESATSTAEVPPATAAASSSEAGDGFTQAATHSPPSAPAASPGLAPEQVTSAARSQPQEGDLPPHTTEMLTPSADGQPPMARPIVLVRLTDDQTHRMINDALAKVSADSSALMESIAADHVDYIFWQIRAQERAILRFD